MRYNYKRHPQATPHPAFPNETPWVAILEVRLSQPTKAARPTARFEAILDSGCADTLFHASIGQSIGIDIKSGIRSDLAGIARGVKIPVYFHDVDLHADADIIRIKAGFSERLPIAGILGRRGFFEHFIVTFDPTFTPPGFEITRVGRA